jgi:hypothetical protein
MALVELYLRNPLADRFALFQDDLLAAKNLRGYLSHCEIPKMGYLNLYTAMFNEDLVKGKEERWHKSDQKGRGALAYVFDNDAVIAMLSAPHTWGKPRDLLPYGRGYRNIDGGVITALTQAGYTEYVHNPTLVQHTGLNQTTIGIEEGIQQQQYPTATTWRGEEWDAKSLLNGKAAEAEMAKT